MKNIVERLANQLKWLYYEQGVRERLRLWDSMGGGKHAEKQIEPFRLLSRPSFNPIGTDDFLPRDPHYRSALPAQKWRKFREYVYHVQKPCYIEPEFGYVVMEPSVLIPESLAWSGMARIQSLMHFFSGVPSIESYNQARRGEKPVRQEQIVVSLRHTFDDNYGHCLIQLMPALFLLEECGVSSDIPIVVSRKLGLSPFFRELTQRGALRNRRWIVQDDAYIHAEEVIFAATEWPSRILLDRFLDAIEVPPGDDGVQRRFFILRRSRQLTNMESLQPILKQYGFELIRPEEFTLAQQITLFSQARVVFGVLGAALTNAIFRRDSLMRILEIQSSVEKDLFFYSLAKTCGYSHRNLVGTPYETRDRYSNFSVEPEKFRAFVDSGVSDL